MNEPCLFHLFDAIKINLFSTFADNKFSLSFTCNIEKFLNNGNQEGIIQIQIVFLFV